MKSNEEPEVVVLYGGVGSEREVSIRSGQAVLASLESQFPKVVGLELNSRKLPSALDPSKQVVFPVLHGEFGEDGELQEKLEKNGFIYAGCDAQSSRLCIHKKKTKEALTLSQVKLPKDKIYQAGDTWEIVSKALGMTVIAKPVSEGSSQGLFVIKNKESWNDFTTQVGDRNFVLEEFVEGVDLTVGVLEGTSLGVVKIMPQGGVYDFERKYVKDLTEYEYPAQLDDELTVLLKGSAESIYEQCGVRDFCRVDFRLNSSNDVYFLEVNTLPGMTETSLFPKSATCLEYSFDSLCLSMVLPAVQRFSQKNYYGS